MLIDVGNIQNLNIDGNFITGRAADTNRIVNKRTGITLASGVMTFISGIVKHYPDPKRAGSSIRRKDDGWGYRNFYYHDGWEEMIESFTRHPHDLVKFDPKELEVIDYDERGNDVDYDVVGDYIDIGRFVEGAPEVFGTLHNGNPRNRRVRIVINFGDASGVSETDLIEKSKRLIRLADSLEKTNIRTEISSIEVSETSYTEVVVKRFDEQLTLEDVAIATNPDFLRRLAFRCIEWSDTYESGYGSSSWLSNRKELLKSTVNDELTVYIDSNIRRPANINKRFDELETQLIEEINQPIPKKSLFVVTNSGVENWDF